MASGYIIAALGDYGSRALAPMLLAMIVEGKLQGLRFGRLKLSGLVFNIEDTIRKLCDRSILPELLDLLSDSGIFSFPINIFSLIGELGDQSILPRLMVLLNDVDADIRLRKGIIHILSEIGDKSVIPTLFTLLYNTEFAQSSAYALMQLDPTVAHKIIPLLFNTDFSERSRMSIASILAASGEHTVLDSLIALLSNRWIETNIQALIAQKLVAAGDDTTRKCLLELLTNQQTEPQIRRNIAYELSELGDKTIIPILQHLRSEPHMRYAVTITLGMLGDRSVLQELTLLLSQQSEFERVYVLADAISKCSRPVELVTMLTNRKFPSDARTRIAEFLGNTGNTSIVPALLSILANSKVILEVRSSVVEAIGKLADDEETVQQLVNLLPGSDIEEHIHEALWAVSRRAGVTVVGSGAGGTMLRVVKR